MPIELHQLIQFTMHSSQFTIFRVYLWIFNCASCIVNCALIKWRPERGSNPWPPAWQAGILTSWTTRPHINSRCAVHNSQFLGSIFWALFLFLIMHSALWFVHCLNGGRNRARTYDPLLVRQMLSQLSYAPIFQFTIQSLQFTIIWVYLLGPNCASCIVICALLKWWPCRDLNPGYRRERAMS